MWHLFLRRGRISRAARAAAVVIAITHPVIASADLLARGSPFAISASSRGSSPGMLCRTVIRAAEHAHAIPGDLLAAIAQVESGRRDAVTGARDPWPWTVDAEGQGAFYPTKAEAIAAVQALQARGVRSIDVGCLQINLQQHPAAFATLDQAFDPATNAAYGARFLTELFAQTGAWAQAAALYHSATPGVADDYRRRVLAAWPGQHMAQSRALGTDMVVASASVGPGATLGSAGLVSAFLPPSRGKAPRPAMMRSAPGGVVFPGRGLAFYRAAPVTLATRIGHAGL